MLRWLFRVAVVVVGAAAFTFSVSVAGAHPTPMPHANPTDIPPSTVGDGSIPLWMALAAVVLVVLAGVVAGLARRAQLKK